MKRLGIIALLLALCVIVAGCSAQSDNKNEKGTGGNTSVSDSDTTGKSGESTTANGKEGATLETVTGSEFEGEIVTFGPADTQENSKEKDNKDKKDKKDEKESSTTSDDNQSYETPIIPID